MALCSTNTLRILQKYIYWYNQTKFYCFHSVLEPQYKERLKESSKNEFLLYNKVSLYQGPFPIFYYLLG